MLRVLDENRVVMVSFVLLPVAGLHAACLMKTISHGGKSESITKTHRREMISIAATSGCAVIQLLVLQQQAQSNFGNIIVKLLTDLVDVLTLVTPRWWKALLIALL